jgi:hypothetical protein
MGVIKESMKDECGRLKANLGSFQGKLRGDILVWLKEAEIRDWPLPNAKRGSGIKWSADS